MEECDRLFDDVTQYAQPRAVGCVAAGEQAADAACGQRHTVRVGVVAAIAQHQAGLSHRRAHAAGHRRHGIDQRQELRHVVTIGRGEDRRQRDAAGVDHEVMF